jgi:hypothetical protein
MMREAETRFLFPAVSHYRLTKDRQAAQTTSTVLELHEENAVRVGRLERHHGLLSIREFHFASVRNVLDAGEI